jgi:hypothetical protein
MRKICYKRREKMDDNKLKLVVDNDNKELPPLKPRFFIPRHACPFYGFIFVSAKRNKGFVGIDINGCGWPKNMFGLSKRGLLARCLMERGGQKVNWDKCKIKIETGQDMEAAISHIRFFPQEFRPESSRWNGLPYEEWKRYVMDFSLERPKPEKK